MRNRYDRPGRAVHFLLRSVPDRQPMGTLRIVEKPLEYKLGRLCILKQYRGLHFGEDLVSVRGYTSGLC
jgi:predicted GNAT family N-acyltransferase